MTVRTAALDVGDPTAMASMMSRFGCEWPALGGIFHAAVAVTPSPLVNMPSDDLLAIMRTKVGGAQLLHRLSKSQPIEFFVNFSSYAALLGLVQYAHHAAANAALDALACSWAAQGVPALSVNWGSWESLRSDYRARVAKAGIRPMSAAVALDALGRLLAAGIPRAVVADFEGQSFVTYMKAEGAAICCLNCPMEKKGTSGGKERVGPANMTFLLIYPRFRALGRLRAIDETGSSRDRASSRTVLTLTPSIRTRAFSNSGSIP